MSEPSLDSFRIRLADRTAIIVNSASLAIRLEKSLADIGARLVTVGTYSVRSSACPPDSIVKSLAGLEEGDLITLLYVHNGELEGRIIGKNLAREDEGIYPKAMERAPE